MGDNDRGPRVASSDPINDPSLTDSPTELEARRSGPSSGLRYTCTFGFTFLCDRHPPPGTPTCTTGMTWKCDTGPTCISGWTIKCDRLMG